MKMLSAKVKAWWKWSINYRDRISNEKQSTIMEMEFIKLTISISGHYSYQDASNEELTILGHFLATDIVCGSSPFKEWVFNDNWGDTCKWLMIEETVCKLKPKEVIIKYENDEFIIETKD